MIESETVAAAIKRNAVLGGPHGWGDVAVPEPKESAAPSAPPLSEEERTELHESVQIMLNYRQISQHPGFIHFQAEMQKDLEALRNELEASVKPEEDIYLKSCIKVYRRVLSIVPKAIAEGEADAQRLKEELERG